MSDLIAEFCREHQSYHDVSKDRRVTQTRVLRQFAATIDHPFSDLSADDLRGFLMAEVERGLMPSTVRKHLRAVSPFLRWLWHRGVIDSGRMMELREVKAPRGANGGQPRPYNQGHLERFWRALERAYPSTEDPQKWLRRWENGWSRYARVMPHAKRTQVEAVVALALYGGLRRVEIFNAQLEDLAPENAYIVVRGAAKNPEGISRTRIVPWNDPLHKAIDEWLTLRARLGPDHDRPWLSLHQEPHFRKPMRARQFNMLLHNIGYGYEFHRFRHTFATEALRAGVPIEILQKMLGHARLQQTLVYAELVEGDVLKAAAKAESSFTRAIERTRDGRQ